MAALASGADGFADSRGSSRARPASWAGGMLALETGTGHQALAAARALAAGFSRTESLRDLTGRDRFFLAWR